MQRFESKNLNGFLLWTLKVGFLGPKTFLDFGETGPKAGSYLWFRD